MGNPDEEPLSAIVADLLALMDELMVMGDLTADDVVAITLPDRSHRADLLLALLRGSVDIPNPDDRG